MDRHLRAVAVTHQSEGIDATNSARTARDDNGLVGDAWDYVGGLTCMNTAVILVCSDTLTGASTLHQVLIIVIIRTQNSELRTQNSELRTQNSEL